MPANPPQTLVERLHAAPALPLTPVIRLVLPVIALLAFTQPFAWTYVGLGLAVFMWASLSTGLYMHRCLTHRGLVLARPLCWFFSLGSAVALGGTPIMWVGVHRQHHAHADTDDDPHAPRHGGAWSQGGWLYHLTPDTVDHFSQLAPDVAADPLHRWLQPQRHIFAVHAAVAALVFAGWGLPGLLWGFYLPLVVNMRSTHALNCFGHLPRWGYRRFDTDDDSTNVWWLALTTLGEGFHNNHHHAPRRARHGLTWYELDINALVIRLLERLGLAREVVW